MEFCLTIRSDENCEIHNSKIFSGKEDVRYFSSHKQKSPNELFQRNVSVLDVVVVVIVNVYFDFHQNHVNKSWHMQRKFNFVQMKWSHLSALHRPLYARHRDLYDATVFCIKFT